MEYLKDGNTGGNRNTSGRKSGGNLMEGIPAKIQKGCRSDRNTSVSSEDIDSLYQFAIPVQEY